ncbi:MAG TPA: fibronectin type III domain-containing protein, partial [Candidatus Lokiarchaeia archaeon]|nr:fibronectin type III domain-containing protein [Candidatus Lokiarchaeia archaeon]
SKTSYKVDAGAWTVYSAQFTLGSFANGTHVISYNSTDNVGNVEVTKTITMKLDKNAPTTTASYTAAYTPNFVNASTTFTLSAVDAGTKESGVAKIGYKVDSGLWTTYSAAFNLGSYINGTHVISYNSTDNVGNVEVTKTITVKLDKNVPTTTASYVPAYAPNFVIGTTTFTMSAVDGGTKESGVAKIGYKVDSGLWTTYSAAFNLGSYANGTHVIYYNATDNVGNVEATKFITVKLDKLAPTTVMNYTAVFAPNFVNGSTTFKLVASDGLGSGITKTSYKVDTGAWTVYSAQFTLGSYANGTHMIYYNSTDNVGNVEATKSLYIKLDKNAPTTTMSYVLAYASNFVNAGTTFTLSAVDAGTGESGVAKSAFRIDSGIWTTYTGSFNLVHYAIGTHVIYYNSTDNAKNVEATKSVTVYRISFLNVNINAPLYYIPVTLTNNQGTATPANFQQQVTINPSANSAMYASNLDNVNWQDGNGNILNSWLESGASSGSASTVYWINLGSNIIAASGGTLIILEVIYATSVNVFNNINTGAYPSYTGTYGQYDNGKNVFSFCANFSGTSLPSGFVKDSAGPTWSFSVNNGLTLTGHSPTSGSNSYIAIWTTSTQSCNIVEMYLTSATLPSISEWNIYLRLPNNNSYRYDWITSTGYRLLKRVSGTDTVLTSISGTYSAPSIETLIWAGTGSEIGQHNYVTKLSSSDSAVPFGSSYLGILLGSSTTSTSTIDVNWLRTRLQPPNGVMPSQSIGTITPAPLSAPRSVIATPKNGQAMLSWQVPSSNGGSPITNYRIYQGTFSGSETYAVMIGNATTYTSTNLTHEQAYYFKVSAVNANGEGELSPEVIVTPSPSFSICSPSGWTGSQTPTVICSFYPGWQGLNVSTVRYAYSTNGSSTPVNWKQVDGVYTDAACTIPASNGIIGLVYAKVIAVPFFQDSSTLNTIRFCATDLGANLDIQATAFMIQVDSIAPVTTIRYTPAFGLNFLNSSTIITLSDSDSNGSGVLTTSYKVDSGAWTTYSAAFNLASYANGTHMISYNSTDNVGNVETTKTIIVKLDRNAPVTTLSYLPAFGSNYINATTKFTVSAVDAGTGESGVSKTNYKVDAGAWTTYSVAFNLGSYANGTHVIYYNSTDNVGNVEATKSVTVKLDKDAPTTTATYTAAYAPNFVNSGTTFTLSAVDGGTKESGVAKTGYKVDSGTWTIYTGPFNLGSYANGTHVIYYNSTDNVGNVETTKSITMRLDKNAPTTTTTSYTAAYAPNFVIATTTFTLSAVDGGTKESGVAKTGYKVDSGTWTTYSAAFNLGSYANGTHVIYYNSTDNVGNVEATKSITVRLDKNAPVTTLSYVPAYGLNYINATTKFTLSAVDAGTGESGVSKTSYKIDAGAGTVYSTPFTLGSYANGTHVIYYNSTDNVGNVETTKSITVRLDKDAPTTTATYTAAYTPNFVNAGTTFTLSAVDGGPKESGVARTGYKVDSGTWTIYTGPFNLGSYANGTHVIYYNSTDNVGIVETTKSITMRLDNNAPTTTASYTAAYAPNFVIATTTFMLSAVDGGTKESGAAKIGYRVDSGTWTTYSAPFNLGSYANGTHVIYYNSTDNVGNVETTKSITLRLDKIAPTTTLNYAATFAPNFVNGSTTFKLVTTDGLGSGVAKTSFKIDSGTWTAYSTPFNLGSYANGTHVIYYNSTDNAGNVETTKSITLRLDKDAPTTTASYTPAYAPNLVIVMTTFTLSAVDAGTKESGVAKIGYKIDSGPWMTYSGLFTLNGYANGTHVIYYNSIDNVGNMEATKSIIVDLDVPPAITHPADITYEFSTTGHAISWIITDTSTNITSFTIHRNGTLIASEPWITGVQITQNVDGLMINSYNYTIFAEDGLGGNVTDSVIVRVVNVPPQLVIQNKIQITHLMTGNQLIFTVLDNSTNGTTYIVLKDGAEIARGSWTSGQQVAINIDGLYIGQYNYTIIIEDGLGSTIRVTVMVDVSLNVPVLIACLIAGIIGFIATVKVNSRVAIRKRKQRARNEEIQLFFIKEGQEFRKNLRKRVPMTMFYDSFLQIHPEWGITQKRFLDVAKAANEAGIIAGIQQIPSDLVMIEPLPIQLTEDPVMVLDLCKQYPYITKDLVMQELGWDERRADMALAFLEEKGFATTDKSFLEGKRFFFLDKKNNAGIPPKV